MGTRSSIAIENKDGSITAIYCHWDGYLSRNGKILQEHYLTEEKVRGLVALGDLSSLGPTLGEKHSLDRYDPNVCTAYGRDRGERDVDAKNYKSVDDWLNHLSQEYDYLFRPTTSTWEVRDHGGNFRPLAEALSEKE